MRVGGYNTKQENMSVQSADMFMRLSAQLL